MKKGGCASCRHLVVRSVIRSTFRQLSIPALQQESASSHGEWALREKALANRSQRRNRVEASSEDSERIPCKGYGGGLHVGLGSDLFVKRGLTEAVHKLELLVQEGWHVPKALLYGALKEGLTERDFNVARRLHYVTTIGGYESSTFLANHMIRMYSSHGRLQEARQVFWRVVEPDCFMWTSIISAHAENGQSMKAIELYRQMRHSTIQPNSHIFVAVLKACATKADLSAGKEVHADVLHSDGVNLFVGNCLVDMFAKCGSLEDARKVFDSLQTKDVVTWNAMLSGYAQHGFGEEALVLYGAMQQDGITPPDRVTFLCLFKACAAVGALLQGKQLHAQLQERQLEVDVVLGSSLVDMYCKCGSIQDAARVFDRLPSKDVVTWNAMIAGYAKQGLSEEALTVYASMQQEGMSTASHGTFVALLSSCASAGALRQGRELHSQIQKRGLDGDLIIGNCLVDMYAKCGSLEDAQRLFDRLPTKNVVTWTSMIAGYAQHGFSLEALRLYTDMERDGISPANEVTFACLLNACANAGVLSEGKKLHSQVQEKGLAANMVVGSSLVDMYAKCGSLDTALRVFKSLQEKNVVTWTAMITGYIEHGRVQEALALFEHMQREGVTPANITYLCLLKACASVGALHQGRRLHSQIHERALETDVGLGSSLVDLYAKCGRLEDARRLFDRLPTKTVVTWTTLMNGYGQSNDGQMAMQCFADMQLNGLEPTDTTFIALLGACSQGGLVHEAEQYLASMAETYGITPNVFHRTCMVDILARSGSLDKAEEMLLLMPFEDGVVGWRSLLSACRSHGDLERGRRCFDHIVKLEPDNASAYVLLANLYAGAGKWTDADTVEQLRRSAAAFKKPATAWIEVNHKVHTFSVGEERDDITSKLKGVNMRLKDEGGHVPHTELVLKAVSEGEKEDALCGHAEKLALAYGLLNTTDGTPLLVTKNLRMCNDCHNGTKIMSRLERREIIVRDAHRVHHFVDGCCSCQDQP